MFSKRTCRKITAQLWAYSVRRLPEDEQEAIEQHLAVCATCRQEAEAFATTVCLLGEFRAAPLPASQTNWQMLQTELTTRESRLVRSRRPALRWSVVALSSAVCALTYLAFLPTRPSFESGKRVTKTWSVTGIAPGGGKKQLATVPLSPSARTAIPIPALGTLETGSKTTRICPPKRRSYASSGNQRHRLSFATWRTRTHKPLHFARAGNQTHTLSSAPALQRRSAPEKEAETISQTLALNVDGDNVAMSILPTNYVLPEVQTAESEPTPCHYVMGQIAPETEPETAQPETTPSKELKPW